MKFIVTAGGQGTKLWPYSRESEPKQFQKIIGEESLFAYTIAILLREFDPSDIYISTKRRYLHLALTQAPLIPPKNYIIEPDIAKNRGPAEGLAFLTLSMTHPDEPFMIIQTDDLRLPEANFLQMIHDAQRLVQRDKKFISGGIKATYPILGIDYLKLSKKVELDSDLEIYEVEEFLDRTDDYYQTKELIENFYITTHSNHNCWYPDLMLEAYAKYTPNTDPTGTKNLCKSKK
jgi:mannose-1-phosphate guanylyltransferase